MYMPSRAIWLCNPCDAGWQLQVAFFAAQRPPRLIIAQPAAGVPLSAVLTQALSCFLGLPPAAPFDALLGPLLLPLQQIPSQVGSGLAGQALASFPPSVEPAVMQGESAAAADQSVAGNQVGSSTLSPILLS